MTKRHISAVCSPLPELGVTPAAFVVFAHLAGLGAMPRFAPYVTGRLIRVERNRPHRTESLRSDETGAICPASATCGGLDSPGPGATARRKPSGLWGASAWRQNPPPSGSLERFAAFLRPLSSCRNLEICVNSHLGGASQPPGRAVGWPPGAGGGAQPARICRGTPGR